MDDVEFDVGNTLVDYSERARRGIGDIDNASGDVRTAVIDPDCHGPPGRDVCHAQFCAERQRRMSGGQIVGVELFAARGLCPLRVEAGNSLRGDLCPVVMPRERGMPFRGRHTPAGEQGCRLTVLQRRLSTGGSKFRIPGDNGGLGAGRQQAPCQRDGKQPSDVPNSRTRDHGRARMNTVRFNVGARNPGTRSAGTVSGRHVVSPICAPAPKPKFDRP
jgi:hypothetical protein